VFTYRKLPVPNRTNKATYFADANANVTGTGHVFTMRSC